MYLNGFVLVLEPTLGNQKVNFLLGELIAFIEGLGLQEEEGSGRPGGGDVS